MKGRITDRGLLAIERVGEIQPQGCPFQPHADDQFPGYGATLCGDWCPHFGEPEAEMELDEVGRCIYATGITRLRLCHGTVLTFDEFADERSGDGN